MSLFPLLLLVTAVIIPAVATLVAWFVKQILDYVSKKREPLLFFVLREVH